MPKVSIYKTNKDGVRTKFKQCPKKRTYRIGARKTGRAGHEIPTTELINMLEMEQQRPKDRVKIRGVLETRNINYT